MTLLLNMISLLCLALPLLALVRPFFPFDQRWLAALAFILALAVRVSLSLVLGYSIY